MKEAPWSNSNTLSTENKEERLSLEILEFEQYISPTPKELRKRLAMEKSMEKFVKQELPGLKLVPFGSHCTELCLPGSDIDVDIRSSSGEETVPRQTLQRLRKCLIRSRMCRYDEILFVPKAKVPVLTIDSPDYYMTIDFTVNNPSPSSDRTITWLKQYPELRPMYLVLKHSLLGLHHPRPNYSPMSSKNSGMASYTLVCLIVNFLEVEAEQHGCDPSSETYYSDLILEFLNFYSSFDFTSKAIRFNYDKPYFSKGATSAIMIQDPDVPESNVARSTTMIDELQECFAFLYNSILEKPENGPLNSILERIIPVDQQEPLIGNRRLEGRDYKIQPLYMTHSDSWATTLRQKAARNEDRRKQRKRHRENRESNQHLRYDENDLEEQENTVNNSGFKNNKWDKNKKRTLEVYDNASSYKANNNKKHRSSSKKNRSGN